MPGTLPPAIKRAPLGAAKSLAPGAAVSSSKLLLVLPSTMRICVPVSLRKTHRPGRLSTKATGLKLFSKMRGASRISFGGSDKLSWNRPSVVSA